MSQQIDPWEDLGEIGHMIAVLFIVGLLIGGCVLGWVYILGPLFNNADYNNFNNSPQHLGAISQQFGRDCLQLSETADSVAQKAIKQDIYQASETVDLKQVSMPDAIRQCVNNAISDVTNSH